MIKPENKRVLHTKSLGWAHVISILLLKLGKQERKFHPALAAGRN
jgi:hypothetical protein